VSTLLTWRTFDRFGIVPLREVTPFATRQVRKVACGVAVLGAGFLARHAAILERVGSLLYSRC